MTAIDEDVELDVDLDSPVSCQRCKGEARWLGRLVCCNDRATLCDICKGKYQEIVDLIILLNDDKPTPCSGCKKPHRGVVWIPL